MGIPRRRTRPGAVPTLAAALASLDDFMAEATMPTSEGVAVIDPKPEFFFRAPGGLSEIPREYLVNGQNSAGWPVPGNYEIHVVDSDGNDLCDPWQARHMDNEELLKRNSEGNAEFLFDEYKSRVRSQRAELEAAEARAKKLAAELAAKDEQIGKLTKNCSALTLANDRAMADKMLAEGRQKEAEDALAAMQEDVLTFQPIVQQGVDRVIERAIQIFGLPSFAPANQAAPSPQEPAPGAEQEQFPPAPSGIDPNPERYRTSLYGLVTDVWKLRPLVEHGFLSWEEARGIMWHIAKVDPGPVPRWDEWESAAKSAEGNQGAAA